MSDNKKIVYSIIKFLKDEFNSLSAEACESIEVAIQCLENAYEIHSDDPSLDIGTPLTRIFASQVGSSSSSKIGKEKEEAGKEETGKEEAEKYKTEGNNLVKAEKFEEAIQCYTKAIQLDPNNPMYYCNRAAAYSRVNNHQATIEDCKAALKIEPTYSKAYGRLGFAYTGLKMFQEAKENYEKALELEPGNQNYINNLQFNEKLKNMSEQSVNGAQRAPNLENFDLNLLLENPSFMSMVSQVISDPAMQNMMTTFVSRNLGEQSTGMESLVQVGQRVAQHMRNTNMDLVEQIYQQIMSIANSNSNPNPNPNSTNPPPKKN